MILHVTNLSLWARVSDTGTQHQRKGLAEERASAGEGSGLYRDSGWYGAISWHYCKLSRYRYHNGSVYLGQVEEIIIEAGGHLPDLGLAVIK